MPAPRPERKRCPRRPLPRPHGAARRPHAGAGPRRGGQPARQSPAVPRGPQALGTFFQENLKYPEAARVKSITGNVLLNATVGPDGRLSGFKVAQSLSPECDAEALRVAALLPPWQPATRLGVPLPVAIQLPVPFGNGATLQVLK
ncbi:energy transducer TonB [Hymenobacter coccineus]|uniref:TonB C-terminal domain-containing protein n=1 Tax=Hymenobacter coccineus TaxID=1908235 RepID=A0A1G1SZB3_9BACT|nr:energy transducer TonB [Hymenobacter coccineus]OGX83963.1 hypothetical protein BEN49_11965 [Hymenobacter coccineus]